MRILLDQGSPAPLKQYLTGHQVQTVFELGWSNYTNGELLALAEESFDLLITTDQQLRYQRNLAGRKLAIAVLMTTSWPQIKTQVVQIVASISEIRPGEYRELTVR